MARARMRHRQCWTRRAVLTWLGQALLLSSICGVGNAVLDSTVVFALLMESDRLPSQARDKRIFTKTGSGQTYGISKRGACVLSSQRVQGGARLIGYERCRDGAGLHPGAKHACLLRRFRLKMPIILPRPARDKHRESTQKEMCVFRRDARRLSTNPALGVS